MLGTPLLSCLRSNRRGELIRVRFLVFHPLTHVWQNVRFYLMQTGEESKREGMVLLCPTTT